MLLAPERLGHGFPMRQWRGHDAASEGKLSQPVVAPLEELHA
jgi:hypothetical protein